MVNAMEELIVKCDSREDFEQFISSLSSYDYKWCDGDRLYDYHPYETKNVARGCTIYVIVNLKDKCIEYSFCADRCTDKNDTIWTTWTAIDKIKNWTPIKKFEDLKCEDFNTVELCKKCPFHNNNLCSLVMTQKETFGEMFKRIEKEFYETKETYEKGDKNE